MNVIESNYRKGVPKRTPILITLLLLMVCLFYFVPMFQNNKIVHADTVTNNYSFSGSNISSKTTFSNGLFSQNLFNATSSEKVVNGLTLSADTSQLYINGVTIAGSINKFGGSSLKAGTYSMCFEVVSGSPEINLIFCLYIADTTNRPTTQQVVLTPTSSQDYKTFTLNEDYADLRMGVYIGSNSGGVSLNDVVVKYQIIEGSNPNYNFQPYQDSTYLNYEFDIYNPVFNGNQSSYLYIDTSIYDSSGNYYRILPPDPDNVLSAPDGVTDFKFPVIPPYDESSGVLYYLTTYAVSYYKFNTSTSLFDESTNFNLYYAFFFDGTSSVLDSERFFKADIMRINIGSYMDYSSYFSYSHNNFDAFDLSTQKYNFISYVDSNNFTFNIFIPLDSNIESDYFQFRTYYLKSSDEAYSSGYNNGLSDGYNNGYDIGKNDGINIGYNDGFDQGYNDGFIDGKDEIINSNESFKDLMFSIVDAPFNVLSNAFNFTIFGINLSSLLIAIVSLALVAVVLKKLL